MRVHTPVVRAEGCLCHVCGQRFTLVGDGAHTKVPYTADLPDGSRVTYSSCNVAEAHVFAGGVVRGGYTPHTRAELKQSFHRKIRRARVFS